MLRRVARISMSLNSRPLATTSTRLDAAKIAELENQLQGNPYFQKFQDRIMKLKESDPETYVKRLELMLDQTEKQKKKEQGDPKTLEQITQEQSQAAKAQPSYVAPKTLDKIMNVEKLKDLTTEQITELWKAYQTPRDSVFAVINKNYWSYISIMAQTFPTFVYPLPRDNNQWFFYVGQWGGNEINFTSLEHYKLNGPDAPVLLSMCHYPDLLEEKEICLMVGDVDAQLIRKEDAHLLAMYVQYFHTEEKGMKLLQCFNTTPENFKYEDVIKAVETIGQ